MQKLLASCIFFMLLAFGACTQEDGTPVLVSTEELLFVGGDKVRISGRLLTNQQVQATDHGFLFSTEASFAGPQTLSLGPKEGPGRFIGESSGFKIGQTYFAKAYADVNGQRIEGEVVELKTLTPSVSSYSPAYASAGNELIIQGRNFPQGTKVFFGTQEATVIQNLFESKLTVRIPPSAGRVVVPIRLLIQDKEIILSQPFEYQAGKFTKVSEFPGLSRIYDNTFFTSSSGFHVGLGRLRLSDAYRVFQRFDPLSGTWTEVNFPGSPRRFGFASATFLGGGALEVDRDVFQFDRSFYRISGSTFERLPDLPFNTREAMATEWNGKLYLFGGRDGAGRVVRMYDPISRNWTQKNTAPFDMNGTTAVFSYGDRIFVLAISGQVWEYLPSQDSWQVRSTYPGNVGQGYPFAQVIGKKAYLGLFRRTQEIWELDLETGQWKSKNQIGGFPQSINVGYFEFNGAIYLLRAPEESTSGALPMELYKFEPDAI
jgi:N-acetylneuraminic acid mutarotase